MKTDLPDRPRTLAHDREFLEIALKIALNIADREAEKILRLKIKQIDKMLEGVIEK